MLVLSAFLLVFPLSIFFGRSSFLPSGCVPLVVFLPVRLRLFPLPSCFSSARVGPSAASASSGPSGAFRNLLGVLLLSGFSPSVPFAAVSLGSSVWVRPRVLHFGLTIVFVCVSSISPTRLGLVSIPWSLCVRLFIHLRSAYRVFYIMCFLLCTLFSWECESGGLTLFIAFLHVASFEGASCAGMPDPEVSGSA